MILSFNGEVSEWDEFNARDVERALNKAKGDITIKAHSFGGSVFEGIRIHNALKAYDKGSITVINTSVNASIMSLIARGADKVVAYKTSSMMIHRASNLAWGNAVEMEKNYQFLNAIDELLAKENMAKNGLSFEENMQLLTDETWYIGGDALLESGLVDEIIEGNEKISTPDKNELKANNEISQKAYAKAYAENNSQIDYKEAQSLVKACGIDCTAVAIPSNEKLANSTKGNAMNKDLQSKTEKELLEAKATIEELQNSTKEGEKALADGVKSAKDNEVARIKDIMAISGISAHLDNDSISDKIYDGATTANDIKALLYDMEQVKAEKQKEAIDAESKESTKDMLEIDGGVDNDAQKKAEAKATEQSIAEYAKANKIKG